jgi:hypothetical protein
MPGTSPGTTEESHADLTHDTLFAAIHMGDHPFDAIDFTGIGP